MAKYMRIGILGPEPYQAPFETDFDALVQKMILHWDKELQSVLSDKPDLILLPEACDRYANFSMEERLQYYEARGNRIREYFEDVCRKNHCYIAYSAARRMPDGSYRNSTQILDRQGRVAGVYNKNHLVVTEVSQGRILCGKDAPVFELDFGRVACVICFDLNFEELRRKYEAAKPDLILFSSMYHGGLIQGEWAYHCRSYFAGAVAGLPCSILNPMGEMIAHSTNHFPYLTADINLDYQIIHLDFNWDKIRAAKHKYGPKLQISDPGFVGAVMLTSESAEFTAEEVIHEFGFELLDDYWERSRQCRERNIEP